MEGNWGTGVRDRVSEYGTATEKKKSDWGTSDQGSAWYYNSLCRPLHLKKGDENFCKTFILKVEVKIKIKGEYLILKGRKLQSLGNRWYQWYKRRRNDHHDNRDVIFPPLEASPQSRSGENKECRMLTQVSRYWTLFCSLTIVHPFNYFWDKGQRSCGVTVWKRVVWNVLTRRSLGHLWATLLLPLTFVNTLLSPKHSCFFFFSPSLLALYLHTGRGRVRISVLNSCTGG